MVQSLTIGTRGSPLALVQTHMVRDGILRHFSDCDITIKIIKTSGDWSPRDGEKRLPTKALFAKEIEAALLNKTIDIAVHSVKDMDSALPSGLVINHMLPREDVRDCMLLSDKMANKSQIKSLSDLPQHCVVGSSSIRRGAVLLSRHPDTRIHVLRGNIDTRIEKLNAGQVDATFLALAGFKRLELAHHADIIIPVTDMTPAAGQGAVGIEMREGEDDIAHILNRISCPETVLCVKTERAVLSAINGSCDTPIGVYARVTEDNILHLTAHLLTPDGSQSWFEERAVPIQTCNQGEALGRSIGEILKPYVT